MWPSEGHIRGMEQMTPEQQQTVRAERAVEIAKKQRITKRGPVWVVPSSSHGGSYVVENDGIKHSCTCPDHELRQQPCKHVLAVEIVRRREMPDGTIITETLRATYSQDWPAYNAAKLNGKWQVEKILKDLCANVIDPPQHMGRKKTPLRDKIPAAAMKVYSCKSGRDNDTDNRRLEKDGVITKAPAFTTLLRLIADPNSTPLFKALVEASAAPLVAIESDFATDSSGFGCATYHRWHDMKHQTERKEHSWVKCHLTCGVRTHVITAIVVKEEWSADSPQFNGLLDSTAERFTINEISADRAYISKANMKHAISYGATLLSPFRKGMGTGAKSPDFWTAAFHYFSYHREAFMRRYNKRSNVETVFHMMKSRFGERVLAKSYAGQINEVFLKALVHNASVLVSCIYELGLEVEFKELLATETETR